MDGIGEECIETKRHLLSSHFGHHILFDKLFTCRERYCTGHVCGALKTGQCIESIRYL